jgi:myo-inositol-1-phosphate synthase
MMNTELTQRKVAQVGEAISHELGVQMVKDYQAANPSDVKAFHIGKDILEQILTQPGCMGVRFYNAYNEMGQKTLVYVGIDAAGKSIIEHVVVDNSGVLSTEKAIVADRAGSTQGIPDSLDIAIEWITEVLF